MVKKERSDFQKMKKNLGGVDIYAIKNEIPLKHIKNFGAISDRRNAFLIKFSGKNVVVDLRGWVYATTKNFEVKRVENLRVIDNRKVLSVEQHGLDRTIALNLMDQKLVIELFGGGNLVLLRDNIIEWTLKRREFKDRKMLPRERYRPPHSENNANELSAEEFEEKIKAGKFDVVRALAVDMGLGGEYSEELCARAGVDKNKNVAEILSEETMTLHEELRQMLGECDSGKGHIYLTEEGKPLSVMPLEAKVYRNPLQFDSFSEAIENYLSLPPDSTGNGKLEEITKTEKQIQMIDGTVEKIYSSYLEIYDKLSAGAEVEIDGFRMDGNKSIELNVEDLYRLKKGLREKIKNVGERIAKSEKQREKKVEKKKKSLWFERYWWFFTSEGFLIIAGKNAGDNERIVKRHLNSNDMYVHADIHGGSSGVIRCGDRKPSEISLKEACQFVACFSKAWGSMSFCDAYWVIADQVSKTPPTGQFLPKGSFMIYGRKNYFKGIGMELTVGLTDLPQIGKKAMCAPESALKSGCKEYAILRPGKLNLERASMKLSQVLSTDEKEFLGVLPTRGIEIVEVKGS